MSYTQHLKKALPERRLNNDDFRDHYDVVIIGGGIYGATMAWEATTRGLTVLLVEQNDFASSTSSNSLKIIHGGIRYLQTFDLVRMRESIKARQSFLRIAPHLVSPLKCLMPTFKDIMKSRLVIFSGFLFYRLMSFNSNKGIDSAKKINHGSLISKIKFAKLFPNLKQKGITGGAIWFDAQTLNSERLVLSFIMSARERGAHVFNYMKSDALISDNNKITGITILDQLTGSKHDIKSSTVIDCSGSWKADKLQCTKDPSHTKAYALAINIVIKKEIVRHAIGIKIPAIIDGKQQTRLLFITPWNNTTIVGTWYSACKQQPDQLSFSNNELKDALQQINSVFEKDLIDLNDVIYIHKGLLPIDPDKGSPANPYLTSRPTILHAQDSGGLYGFFQVQGVKYTTARTVAEQTINRVFKHLQKPLLQSNTHQIPLYGADYSSFSDWKETQVQKYSKTYSWEVINRLMYNYGSNMEIILKIANEKYSQSNIIAGTNTALKAEIDFVLDNEMTFTLTDILLRRTDIGTQGLPAVETINYCVCALTEKYDWNETDVKQNIEKLLSFYPDWTTSEHKKVYEI